MTDLDLLRLRGVRLLAISGWMFTATMALLNWAHDFDNGGTAILLSAMINVVPSVAAWQRRFDRAARLTFGTAAAVHPALLVFMLEGHAWQMDMHMYFFVCLAALALLCDWRPIALAGGLVAVHHLFSASLSPSWAFESGGDAERVTIHAVAVILQVLALSHVTTRLRSLIIAQSVAREQSQALAAEAVEAGARAEAARAEAEAARKDAEEARGKAEGALASATFSERAAAHERKQRETADARAEAMRRAELLALADAFEESIANVSLTVSGAASQLEDAARKLSALARTTGRQATDVAMTAEQASDATKSVADGIAAMSRSIRNIAHSVQQQANLTELAQGNYATGQDAVRALADRTGNIGTLVQQIQTVASRTNLLALNAAIEASRAGEAGRGFAVVASEVKALAQQAEQATTDITLHITGVSAGAVHAEDALRDVSHAVEELNQTASLIRGEIEGQQGASDVINRSAEDVALGASQVAAQIGRVAEAAIAAETLSQDVEGAASALMRSAGTLQDATARFINQLRAA